MAETAIEWADYTFNPWIGCTKVSPGCDHCYAEALSKARLGVRWGPGEDRRHTAPSTWKQPLAWNRKAGRESRRYRVFCASLADVFDNAVPDEWRRELAALIAATPNLDWLLLTKRIGNAKAMLLAMFPGSEPVLANLWLGATVVNQDEADRDVPKLLATPAAVRFLSCEPLLGPVDLALPLPQEPDDFRYWSHRTQGLDWIIVGGESGPGARPMHPDWARSIRDQCAAAMVPFLFKQWGEWAPLPVGASDPIWSQPITGNRHAFAKSHGYDAPIYRIGKKAAGRLLDGVTHDGFPHPLTPNAMARGAGHGLR